MRSIKPEISRFRVLASHDPGMTNSRGTRVSDTFDFVIVGAGSGGSTLAGRLSEDKNTSVALLDAGGKNDNWVVTTPFALVLMVAGNVNADVACCAAGAAAPDVTMTSTLSRASSAAMSAKRSLLPPPSEPRSRPCGPRSSEFAQSLHKCRDPGTPGRSRASDQHADDWPLGRLLRAKSGHAAAAPPAIRRNFRSLIDASDFANVVLSNQPRSC
jgi:choline dehydrogenase-like flavoprotein